MYSLSLIHILHSDMGSIRLRTMLEENTTKQVGMSVIASTLTSVCVFLSLIHI